MYMFAKASDIIKRENTPHQCSLRYVGIAAEIGVFVHAQVAARVLSCSPEHGGTAAKEEG